MAEQETQQKYDLICVGGGIMSATLALMTKIIDPDAKVMIFERLDKVAEESSEVLNNSGTGHSAFCELNYTPMLEDGSINMSKALRIFTEFERSKQFWSYLVEKGYIQKPNEFIRAMSHHSWVRGEIQVQFLRKRFEEMKCHMSFEQMEYTEEFTTMKEWFPLIMKERSEMEPMAATKMGAGTEISFERLTELYFDILKNRFRTEVLTGFEVQDLNRKSEKTWQVEVEHLAKGENLFYEAKHVFIGAGGGALPLLQKSEIDAIEDYGGFPVSGQWLRCKNEELVEKHHAKVYIRAGEKAPPMSEPHLDTRFVNGEKALFFGPFAGFSTKFLNEGSYLDLPKSINFDNIPAYWGAFWHNLDLTRYLLDQVTMDHEDRMKALRDFITDAKAEDWELQVAGIRVQVIKREQGKGGDVEFGTDIVHNDDGSITGLLGASPGASTAVDIMMNILKIAFPEKMDSDKWQQKLKEMIPCGQRTLDGNEEEFKTLQKICGQNLGLKTVH